MDNKNIFCTGGRVNPDEVIGYRRFYDSDRFERVVRDKLEGTGGIAVTGLPRTGKTSLVYNVCERIAKTSDNVILIEKDVAEFKAENGFNNLFNDVIREIRKHVDNKSCDENLSEVKNSIELFEDDFEVGSYLIRSDFKEIVSNLKNVGIKVILVLDEFDSASSFFDDSKFEFLRSLASGLLVLITISRRRLIMISASNGQSTLAGVMHDYILNGFNNDDIEDYHKKLKENYCIVLTEEDRMALEAYCGSSPYIWSYFGNLIVQNHFNKVCKSVKEIYSQKLALKINDFYHTLDEALNSDLVDHHCVKDNKSKSFLDIIIGTVIGPSSIVTRSDLEILQQLGYIRKGESGYYALSECYNRHLREERMYKSDDLTNQICDVEKRLKLMISEELDEECKLDNDWYNLLEKCGGDISARSRYFKYISNNKDLFNVESTVLDVMSLKHACCIIKFKWHERFAKYFNYDPYDKWRAKFDLCARARNPIHHVHPEFLSREEQEAVGLYCNEIIKQVGNSYKCEMTV